MFYNINIIFFVEE